MARTVFVSMLVARDSFPRALAFRDRVCRSSRHAFGSVLGFDSPCSASLVGRVQKSPDADIRPDVNVPAVVAVLSE